MAKKEQALKTNAARLLDRAKIPYRIILYEVDENDLAARYVADSLGEDIRKVFKTLVLHGEPAGPKGQGAGANKGTYFVCVVPGNREVDLKKAAAAAGMKKADLIPMKELLPLTSYIRGGCSPIGMRKPFPTFFHSSAMEFDQIYVSAGVRGAQIEISPASLIKFVGADIADLVNDSDE